MTTLFRQASAKIYQFPTRPRAIAADHRIENRPALGLAGQSAPAIVYGAGWYHDAAIQDAQRTGKR